MSIDEVVARSAASKGQVYHYFRSREALLHAAVDATIDDVVQLQDGMMDRLDSWSTIQAWFDCLVDLQVTLDARGGCPMAMLSAHLVETDEHVRAQLLAGFDRWESTLKQGIASMRERGMLVTEADPSELATATMASIQGGLVLTQVRRDPAQLRIALRSGWSYLQAFAAPAA